MRKKKVSKVQSNGLIAEGEETTTRSMLAYKRKQVIIVALLLVTGFSEWNAKRSLAAISQNLTYDDGMFSSAIATTTSTITNSSTLKSEPSNLPPSVDRIYYINLDRSTERRDLMEGWLKKQHSTIPYERVPAQLGKEGVCHPWKDTIPGHCLGTSGLVYSNLHIIENYNTTGLTLVLEDDYQIFNLSKINNLLRTPKLIPDDWDTLRFNCWGVKKNDKRLQIVKHPNRPPRKGVQVMRACPKRSYVGPHFCGGTHATLWKDSAIPKLKKAWSRMPLDDVDVRLWTSEMKNYCIQLPSFGLLSRHYHKTIPRGKKNKTLAASDAIVAWRKEATDGP